MLVQHKYQVCYYRWETGSNENESGIVCATPHLMRTHGVDGVKGIEMPGPIPE